MLKTLNWYIASNFIYTFLMAMAVLTFGMTGARLVRVFEYISNGVDISAALKFMMYVLPIALAFTIPWAALVSIMLVFGRLSADNEITAMRACGISILQIVAPIIVITFGLTLLCLYLQLDIGPRYLGKSKEVIKNVAVDSPLAIFEPGVQLEFEDFRILIDQRDPKTGIITGIQFYKMDGTEIEQDVTASRGQIKVDKDRQILHIVLENATIIAYDHHDPNPRRSFSKNITFSLEYGKKFNSAEILQQNKHESYRALYARSIIEHERGNREEITDIETELNQRVALALAPIAFLLLGLPMAIRTSRRETSVGLFLSVLLAGIYFGAVLLSDTLSGIPWVYPQFIVWIPPVLYEIFGAIYIFKIARK